MRSQTGRVAGKKLGNKELEAAGCRLGFVEARRVQGKTKRDVGKKTSLCSRYSMCESGEEGRSEKAREEGTRVETTDQAK